MAVDDSLHAVVARSRTRLVALALCVATLVTTSATRASSPEPAGCYRFNRPLGKSAAGHLEAGDSSWYRVQLLAGGLVARPRLGSAFWREQFAARSSWREHGDTLLVRLSTGLVGWDLTLIAERNGYSGTARYLSDALGGQPFVVPVQAEREPCSDAPPPRVNR